MVRTPRVLAAIAIVMALSACQPAASTVRNATAPRQPAAPTQPVAAAKPGPAPATTAPRPAARPAPTTTTAPPPPATPTTGNPRCDAFAEPIRAAQSVGYTIDCTKPGHGGSSANPLGGITSFGMKRIWIYLDLLPSPPMVEYMLWHEVGHALGHDHPDTDKLAHCRMAPGNRGAIAWLPQWIPVGNDCARLTP